MRTKFYVIIFLLISVLSFAEEPAGTSTIPETGTEAAPDADSQPAAPEKKKVSFRDAQDGYFDLGDFVINSHGFIPVPIIITEPALGYFGGGLMPVFIKPNKPREKNGKSYYTPPDITSILGAGTLNSTWAVGAGIQLGAQAGREVHAAMRDTQLA